MIRQFALLAASLLSLPMVAQETFTLHRGTQLSVRTITTDVYRPNGLAIDASGMLWALESQAGTILRIDPTSGAKTVVLQSPFSIPTTQGTSSINTVYDIVIDPDFNGSHPYIYLAHSTTDGSQLVTRMTYAGERLADPLVLLRTDPVPTSQPCTLLLLPDGTLLFGTGSFDTPAPQDMNSMCGKVLRLRTDGTAPDNNPFFDPLAPTSAASYQFSRGHRALQGMVRVPRIDAALEGTIYGTEWGSKAGDEINALAAGKNYGWPNVEGYCTTSTSTYTCPLTTSDALFTGLAYYAHPAIPEWNRKLLVGSNRLERLLVMDLDNTGEIANKDGSLNPQNVTTLADSNRILFASMEIPERPRDVLASNDGRIYIALHQITDAGGIDRIVVLENPAMQVLVSSVNEDVATNGLFVSPNPVSDHMTVRVTDLPSVAWTVSCTDQLGRIMFTTSVAAGTDVVTIPCSDLPTGAYGVTVQSGPTTQHTTVIR